MSSEGSGDDGVAAGVAALDNVVVECVPVSSFVDLGAACGAVHVEGQVVVVVVAEAVRIQVAKRVESVADRCSVEEVIDVVGASGSDVTFTKLKTHFQIVADDVGNS